jgi:hypothetical protein
MDFKKVCFDAYKKFFREYESEDTGTLYSLMPTDYTFIA